MNKGYYNVDGCDFSIVYQNRKSRAILEKRSELGGLRRE